MQMRFLVRLALFLALVHVAVASSTLMALWNYFLSELAYTGVCTTLSSYPGVCIRI